MDASYERGQSPERAVAPYMDGPMNVQQLSVVPHMHKDMPY